MYYSTEYNWEDMWANAWDTEENSHMKRFSERQFQMPSNMWAKYKSAQAAFTHSWFNRLIPFCLLTNGIGYSKHQQQFQQLLILGLWNKIAKDLRIMTRGYMYLFWFAFTWTFIINNQTITFKLILRGILQVICCGKMSSLHLLKYQLFAFVMEVA